MQQPNALIIFARNLIRGKVKTRLAATIGVDRAYEVYKQLLAHTHGATRGIEADKWIYYSADVAADDLWEAGYLKAVQRGLDLGERMRNAFAAIFRKGYAKAVLIGTDCPELSEDILQNAFEQLDRHDIVIGPAHDGGYYLLGMRALHPDLFSGIAWSTPAVFETTKAICERSQLRYATLPPLHDIDEEKDLIHLNKTKVSRDGT